MEFYAFLLHAILVIASVALVIVVAVGGFYAAALVGEEVVIFVNKYRFTFLAIAIAWFSVISMLERRPSF